MKHNHKKRIQKTALKLNLHKVDLQSVVGKYLGETEKNLNRVFADAEKNGSILFFDEADALFGKRSEIKDSHERYANLDVAYLSQKIKKHKGIVILALNFASNIDQKVARRMNIWMELPLPDASSRLKIWKNSMQ